MQESVSATFDALVSLVKEVKPSLAAVEIAPESSVVDDLGLDSLDVLQLSRLIRRAMDQELDLDSWSAGAETHRMSVQSILDSLSATTAV
ncbi:MAG: phosphopantetheine-binding protein [Pseudonocardiaceae bacterium]